MDLRYLDVQDATYLNAGFGYDLTDKYTVAVWANDDTDRSEFQSVAAEIAALPEHDRRRGRFDQRDHRRDRLRLRDPALCAGGEAGITGLGSNGASSRVGGL